MKWWFLVAIACSACGRFGFDSRDAPADTAVDTPTDMRTADCGHTFCDHFLRPDNLQGAWDGVENTTGSTLLLDADTGVGMPGSFLLTLPATGENGFLVKHFTAASPMTVTIDLQLSYATADLGTNCEIDMVQLKWDDLPPPCTSFGYFLVRDGTGPFNLQETYGGCGGNENTPLLDLANDGFHHVVMTVTLGTKNGTARVGVDIDGAPVLPPKLTSHDIVNSPLTLRIGGGGIRNLAASWDVHYDDVLVDLQ